MKGGLFKTSYKGKMADDNKYSRAVGIPQYLPVNKKPVIDALVNTEKYTELVRNINRSSVTDSEKQFLKLAAARHLCFNYSQIADYYAHSDAEMQKLMEDSGLVIIDIDDAIANGYIVMSERFEEIINEAKKYKQS